MTDNQTRVVSWLECDCDYTSKYCDENHRRTAIVPLAVLEGRDGDITVATALRARLNAPVHPYGDKRIPVVPEHEFLRNAYDDALVDDLLAIANRGGVRP